ncbi:MAG: MFS transporter [Caldimonas sp.]
MLLLVGSCLPILASVLIAPLLPSIQQHFMGTEQVAVLVPILMTAPALMVAFLGPIAGVLVDWAGRKRLLVISFMLYAGFGVLPLWLDSLSIMVASRVALGMTEAVIITCCMSLIGDYYDGAKRTRMLSLQAAASTASAAIFFLMGGALGDISWRTPFALYAVGVLLAVGSAIWLWEPAPDAAPAASAVPASPFPWRRMWPLYLVTVFAATVFYVSIVQAGFVLEALQIRAASLVGIAIALSQVAGLVSALSFRWLARLGTAFVLALAFALSGAGLAELAMAESYLGVVLALICAGIGGGLIPPALSTWALSRLDFEHRGRGTGSFMGSFYIGQFISPLAVLVLMPVVGGRLGAIGLIAAAAGVAAVAAVLIGRRTRAGQVAGVAA